jgi:branched-chain amino acid aminotransferase
MTDSNNRLIWLNGRIVPLPEATINVLSPTAQFGANVFEGIRCYWNETVNQLYAFRLEDHYRRLHNSMKLFRMEGHYSDDILRQGLIDVVKANAYKEDIAVRQTVFVDGFGTWSSKGPLGMFIAPIAKARVQMASQKGLRCCVSSWTRISDRNLSPKMKVGANYINSRMAQLEAVEAGYDTALFMNEQGKMAEGPGSCLFVVRDGVLLTPPFTASVLESITRDTLLELAAAKLGLRVEVRDIDRTELYLCDEAFLCGSAMELVPVVNVDGYTVGEGTCGLLTQRLHAAYLEVVTGNDTKYNHWLTGIY